MFEPPSITPTNSLGTEASSYSSPSFNEAVNAARFVKVFGIAALSYSIGLLFGKVLGGGIGLGIGLFIMRYDSAKYYRVLGITVMVFAIVGIFFPFLGPAVLSGAILGKGIQVLGVLAKEGRNDEAWMPSRTRALIGTIASGAGLLISLSLMFLFALGTVALLLGWAA